MINGMVLINSDDRTFIGTLPKLEYGINISLAYKNFDFFFLDLCSWKSWG
jgi:hypothetical protein